MEFLKKMSLSLSLQLNTELMYAHSVTSDN